MRQLIVVSALTLVVSACGVAGQVAENVAENVAEQVAEQAAEAQTGTSVAIEQSDGTLQVEAGSDGERVVIEEEDGTIRVETEDAEGTYTVGETEIPDDFPIPLPDDATVLIVAEATEGGTTTRSVTVTYPGDRWDEIVEFFGEWADGLEGETEQLVMTTPVRSLYLGNDDAGLYVTAMDQGGEIQVTAVVEETG